MKHRIEIADWLAAIADEVQGIAEVLSVLRENEELQGASAKHILLLQHDAERIIGKIWKISEKIGMKGIPR